MDSAADGLSGDTRHRGPGRALALPWRDPLDVLAAFAGAPGISFLHSSGTAGPRSRYSYLCVDPLRVLEDAPLGELGAVLGAYGQVWPDAPVPFAGGAVGFVGYEAGSALERIARPAGAFAGVPDMRFAVHDLVLAWDHAHGRSWLLSALGDTGRRLDAVLHRYGAAASHQELPRLAWRRGVTRAIHMDRVRRALHYIQAGDIYQANITAPFVADRPPGLRAAALFAALSTANPAPFSAFIDTGGGTAIASVSPERFIQMTASGEIEARPIKGTRPRGATPEQDAAETAILRGSCKDRAENLMIVDLLRNDISRVALPGTVRVPELNVLESFASVHHLVSAVTGRLRPGATAVDLLRATLPGGSITGAPKIRAMQIIAALEQSARGPYCGSVCWLGFDGAMDSNILIRTVTVTQDQVIAQAGGGIVADSDPAAEWDELMVKITPVLRALGDMPA